MSECIFCKIIQGKSPAEIVHQEDGFIVLKDIQPKAPVHLLIIPRKHITSLNDASESDQLLLGKMMHHTGWLAKKFNISQRGYKVVVNCGEDGGQVVPHLHIHFLGGEKVGGLV